MALAPWYLKAACIEKKLEIDILEMTINDDQNRILRAIYSHRPDIIAFSCYIWNVNMCRVLAANVKKILPLSVVIFGGPEVSFESEQFMEDNEAIDYLICGEGEESLPFLLKKLSSNGNDITSAVIPDGILNRDKNSRQICGKAFYQTIDQLDKIPSPYTKEMLSRAAGKLIYYESSRGCSAGCTYCLSPSMGNVRYFSIERVFEEIKIISKCGARAVKFVDRTFNKNTARANKIIGFILKMLTSASASASAFSSVSDSTSASTSTFTFSSSSDSTSGSASASDSSTSASASAITFHFEIDPLLIDDSFIELIKSAPPGLFRFEAGIQSTCRKTLRAVCRNDNIDKALVNLQKLTSCKNVLLHSDLIAGLPYEDYNSFKNSFNDLYRTKPDEIQAGFLKILKGSAISLQKEKWGIVNMEEAPYEVLSTDSLGFDDILELKELEEMVEDYFNSGNFKLTLDYLFETGLIANPFEFYHDIFEFAFENNKAIDATEIVSGNNLYDKKHKLSLRDRFAIFADYLESKILAENKTGKYFIFELLCIDWFSISPYESFPAALSDRMSKKIEFVTIDIGKSAFSSKKKEPGRSKVSRGIIITPEIAGYLKDKEYILKRKKLEILKPDSMLVSLRGS